MYFINWVIGVLYQLCPNMQVMAKMANLAKNRRRIDENLYAKVSLWEQQFWEKWHIWQKWRILPSFAPKFKRDGRGVCQCAAFVWTDLKIGRAVLLFYRVLMIQTYIILKIKGQYKLLGDCKPGTDSFVRSKQFKMTKFANCCTVGLQVSALQKKLTQLFSRG